MAKTNTAVFATASELLAPGVGEKEVVLKTLGGKKVTIKRLNMGDIAAVVKAAKTDEIYQFILLCFKGLVRPKMNIEQCKKLPLKVTMELATEISKFSELDKDSIEKVRNLLETVT